MSRFVVDATLATPYLCRPIEHGADIVVHSATKFIGGHGTSIGGVVVESGRFDWANGRFPLMTEPVASYGGLSWWGNFAEYGFLTRLRAEQLRDVGATMTPFNAFLFLLGLETLPLRMAAHVENAATVADFLDGHPAVTWVAYAGLPPRRGTSWLAATCPLGPGAVFSFGVVGGRAGGRALHRRGRARQPPGQRRRRQDPGDPPGQHHPRPAGRRRPRRRRRLTGADPDSVGIEDAEDICRDLDQRAADRHGVTAWVNPGARERQQILERTRSVAMVGASPNPSRASYFVLTYLRADTDFRLYLVNPTATEILGLPVYPRLADLPAVPDLVDVFRRIEDLPAVADDAIAVGARTLWFQLGLRHDQRLSGPTTPG